MGTVKLPPNIEQNPMALALWARSLFYKDHFDEAFAAGVAALELAPGDGEIRDLVSSALSSSVAPYHIPMLHDSARSHAYARAIEAAVRPGMRVFEIGTGAGLLALIAARAGAEVYTCERVGIAASAARYIAEQNGLGDRVHVINKHSTDVVLGEDLPGPADLLVSEIFGNKMFNEGVVDAIADAKTRLTAPDAPIVPPRVQVRCALVESETKADRADLRDVEGFEMSAVNLLRRPSSEWLECKDGRTQQRSTAQSALVKDFQSQPPFGEDISVVDLVSDGGEVTGVAQWLRIDFGDGNLLENAPFEGQPSSWGRPITLFPRPISTRPGEIVRIKLRRLGEALIISPVY